jgi:cytochrome c biogenesis protein CcmG/thiol:disulfide interchange protein DsbE
MSARLRLLTLGIGVTMLALQSAWALDLGSQAPRFVLKDLNNKKVTLDDLIGKGPVVIDFWATWCKPCIEEFGPLSEILKRYEEDGLVVVAISLDGPRTLSKVKPFVTSRRLPFLFLVDPEGITSNLYRVRTIPVTFVLDSQGQIRYSRVGYKRGQEKSMEKVIADLVAEEKSATEQPYTTTAEGENT